ncbi:hypothetical protein HDU76_013622 [Blyttiomyces sp. JEL0837]|nr:hypothetical protein HDU76_013622 [Blyttiomyces sp. JEL0837]
MGFEVQFGTDVDKTVRVRYPAVVKGLNGYELASFDDSVDGGLQVNKGLVDYEKAVGKLKDAWKFMCSVREGEALVHQGRIKEAHQVFKQALKLDIDFPKLKTSTFQSFDPLFMSIYEKLLFLVFGTSMMNKEWDMALRYSEAFDSHLFDEIIRCMHVRVLALATLGYYDWALEDLQALGIYTPGLKSLDDDTVLGEDINDVVVSESGIDFPIGEWVQRKRDMEEEVVWNKIRQAVGLGKGCFLARAQAGVACFNGAEAYVFGGFGKLDNGNVRLYRDVIRMCHFGVDEDEDGRAGDVSCSEKDEDSVEGMVFSWTGTRPYNGMEPSPRAECTLTIDSARRRAILIGGYFSIEEGVGNGDVITDIWQLSVSKGEDDM